MDAGIPNNIIFKNIKLYNHVRSFVVRLVVSSNFFGLDETKIFYNQLSETYVSYLDVENIESRKYWKANEAVPADLYRRKKRVAAAVTKQFQREWWMKAGGNSVSRCDTTYAISNYSATTFAA
ncbi:hypothetical protein VV869_21470 [Photobacterium sp. MCCC 1A19761]|uniref:hypothetical protein n=1 Tax=Photobacterium sp. MCCC 1A19761 TaxID=3115000 RepID=UPI00307E0C83